MIFSIERSEVWHKYQVINTDDILKHGFEKAIILANIDRYSSPYHGPDRHLYFPYFSKDRFDELVYELTKDGFIIEVYHE